MVQSEESVRRDWLLKFGPCKVVYADSSSTVTISCDSADSPNTVTISSGKEVCADSSNKVTTSSGKDVCADSPNKVNYQQW